MFFEKAPKYATGYAVLCVEMSNEILSFQY